MKSFHCFVLMFSDWEPTEYQSIILYVLHFNYVKVLFFCFLFWFQTSKLINDSYYNFPLFKHRKSVLFHRGYSISASRTQSNFLDEAFCDSSWRLKTVQFHVRYLSGFWKRVSAEKTVSKQVTWFKTYFLLDHAMS